MALISCVNVVHQSENANRDNPGWIPLMFIYYQTVETAGELVVLTPAGAQHV